MISTPPICVSKAKRRAKELVPAPSGCPAQNEMGEPGIFCWQWAHSWTLANASLCCPSIHVPSFFVNYSGQGAVLSHIGRYHIVNSDNSNRLCFARLGIPPNLSGSDWFAVKLLSTVLLSCWSRLLLTLGMRQVGWDLARALQHSDCTHLEVSPWGDVAVSVVYSRVKGVTFSWRIRRAVLCYSFPPLA